MNLDMTKLEALQHKLLEEMGAAATAALVVVGDKLGLYTALAEGPATSEELARRTGLHERYVREWLAAQAASGYAQYAPADRRFSLTPEQAAVFADPEALTNMSAAFHVINAEHLAVERITQAFRAGTGVGWGEHAPGLFCGTAAFYRAGYRAFLVQQWLPALAGMVERLERGARVADVGCGHGASTVVMARAFPKSTFVGFDPHLPSLEVARADARAAGLKNVTFEAGTAHDFGGGPYDLVACFDALHDMGDPVGAAAAVRKRLAPEGAFLVVEPFAGDKLEDNLNPVGRIYYAGSTMLCTPGALSQGRTALGAQAGEARLREVFAAGGFTRVRQAARTPFNLILEARP